MGAAAQAGSKATTNKAADTGKAPARKSRAKAAADATTESEDSGEKGAARPRKFDYGIADDATLVMKVDEEKVPSMRGDMTGWYTAASKSKTVAEYYSNGGERAGLRRLMRRGIIGLKGADGTEYPRDYVAPEPKAKTEASEPTEG